MNGNTKFRLIIGTFVLGTAALTGCETKSPTAPTVTPETKIYKEIEGPIKGVPLLLYHNIPATTDSGSVVWVCATQYRTYCKDGFCEQSIDHYIQNTSCPDVPIN
jgi:hypothetical protein